MRRIPPSVLVPEAPSSPARSTELSDCEDSHRAWSPRRRPDGNRRIAVARFLWGNS
jgi:hypothetical protein